MCVATVEHALMAEEAEAWLLSPKYETATKDRPTKAVVFRIKKWAPTMSIFSLRRRPQRIRVHSNHASDKRSTNEDGSFPDQEMGTNEENLFTTTTTATANQSPFKCRSCEVCYALSGCKFLLSVPVASKGVLYSLL